MQETITNRAGACVRVGLAPLPFCKTRSVALEATAPCTGTTGVPPSRAAAWGGWLCVQATFHGSRGVWGDWRTAAAWGRSSHPRPEPPGRARFRGRRVGESTVDTRSLAGLFLRLPCVRGQDMSHATPPRPGLSGRSVQKTDGAQSKRSRAKELSRKVCAGPESSRPPSHGRCSHGRSSPRPPPPARLRPDTARPRPQGAGPGRGGCVILERRHLTTEFTVTACRAVGGPGVPRPVPARPAGPC